jgi:hypothetical protein
MEDNSHNKVPGHCQLIESTLGTEPVRWYLARRARGLGRRMKRLVARLRQTDPATAQRTQLPAEASNSRANVELTAGDWIRVRSRAEIQQMLDADGRRGGCAFLEPMARYCGQEFRVARRVEHFFDEARWRMLKCRSVVLLEGVHCDGSGHPDTRGCDRLCYFFWRTEWLERVSAPAARLEPKP